MPNWIESKSEAGGSMSACGFGDKECAICRHIGYCVAAMNDDYYYPATKEQVIERLDKGMFKSYRSLMKSYLCSKFNYQYESNEDEE